MDDITAETRADAFAEIQKTAEANERVIEEMMRYHYPYGATCYEIARLLCWQITSVRPRMTTLKDKGKFVVVGKRVNPECSPRACAVYAPAKTGELPLNFRTE